MDKLETKTLAWVNRLRVKVDQRPLKRLPKGHIGIYDACPLANALPSYCCVLFRGRDAICYPVHPPGYIMEFTIKFDQSEYPHLVAKNNERH